MYSRLLLVASAAIEAGAGLTLIILPSVAVMLLFGSPLDTPAGIAVGRVAGVALLALALACWRARHGGENHATRGLIAAMLLYNCAVGLILAFAGIGSGLVGIALWPAVVLHAAMAVWCIVFVSAKN
jgi:hypothetical protein